MQPGYQQCTRCVLDTTVRDIVFDEAGVCSYCHAYDRFSASVLNITPEQKKKRLDFIVGCIKKSGKNKKYDCLLGISGGVDSSYLAYLSKQLGLRPLIVHFDNGWNSELAVKNIEQIVSKLNLDLHTYVIQWEEFRDIHLAYLKASVVDVEVPTDQYIMAVLYKIAAQYGIHYILSGYNYATEYGMPEGWNYPDKLDQVNLVNIHKKHGAVKLKDFPRLGYYQKFYYENIKCIEVVSLLNLVDYNKKKVKEILINELGWQDYGGKHHESVFTKFYQSYILPNKFGIDKRKSHWSSLIWSGQAKREEALQDMNTPFYGNELSMKTDKQYVMKKLELSDNDFNKILSAPAVPHGMYGTENIKSADKRIFNFFMFPLARILKKYWFIKATGSWRVKIE